MFRNFFQFIFCLLLLCSVRLFAADTQAVVTADCANFSIGGTYECDFAEEGEVIVQEYESLGGLVSLATAFSDTSDEPLHGQPLPGTLLSVLLAGVLMKAFARLRRHVASRYAILSELFAQSIHRLISIVRYFRTVGSLYTCCWEWQKTVLRL